MGLTAERLAVEDEISREDQDLFAYNSHRKALAAQNEGRFEGEIVPVPALVSAPTGPGATSGCENRSNCHPCPSQLHC